jgi:ATP-dependent RNA helicase RhlE
MQFEELKLIAPLLKAIREQGYDTPTPIQEMAIPDVLAGRDLLGCAQTGAGKTAAFALPILQRLLAAGIPFGKRRIRALILAPTRELAAQIDECFGAYGAHTGLRHTVIFGGVRQGPQTRALERGVDILVATPGRLLDLTHQGFVDLRFVETLVLDEGDRMLDMGFIGDIRRIVAKTPSKRQTLLFSATLHSNVRDLLAGLLDNPVEVCATPAATPVESIRQAVYFVEKSNKIPLLVHLLTQQDLRRVLVFTRTKHGADAVVRNLARASVSADAIHGNKSQGQREAVLENFKRGKSRVLVATDIASRGLDIDHVTHVVNFDMPHEPEAYVHRIGRTGRAGLSGIALSFCAIDERADLSAIEKLIRTRVPVEDEHPFRSSVPVVIAPRKVFSSAKHGSGRRMPSRSSRRVASR